MGKKINPIDISDTGLTAQEFNEMNCLGLVEWPKQRDLKNGEIIKFKKVLLNVESNFIFDCFRYVRQF